VYPTRIQFWLESYYPSRVARGGTMGAIAPPIPKVAPKGFRAIKLLMRKPKKYFKANQSNCLRYLSHFSL